MPFTKRKPIKLHLNENPYPASPECESLFDSFNLKQFSYYSSLSPSLKENLSKQFTIPVDEIILGSGAEDILKQSFFWLLKKGDTILLPSVGWHYYQQVASQVGAHIILYNMIEQEDQYTYDVDQILSLLKEHDVKLLFITSPSNPVGTNIDKTVLETILNGMPEGTRCILDEAYWGFKEEEYVYHELIIKYPVLILRTFSKLFALAGLRVGYAFGSHKSWGGLLQLMGRYLGINSFSEMIANEALNSMPYYKAIAKEILSEGEKYFTQLRAMGLKVLRTSANFIFVRFSQEDFSLLKAELPKRDVVIKFFDGHKEPLFYNCVRITIGLPKENDYLIETIRQILKKA